MPQLGMVVGGMIGGAISPDKINAPSIGDASQQASQAGVPRPVVYGHPAPFAGNIIDGEGKARKIFVKERQGKGGGPIVKSERFILTYAVRICEGPIAGVVRIWRNGEVVLDRRTDAQIAATYGAGGDTTKYTAEMRAKSAAFLKKIRIYLGTESQLPDPSLEALHGVGNTPYFRGTAYMVLTDSDETDTRGAAAQYQFEVVAVGAETSAVVIIPSNYDEAVSQGNGGGFYTINAFAGINSVPIIKLDVDALHGNGAPSRFIMKIGSRVLHDTGWRGSPTHQSDLDAQLVSLGMSDLIGQIATQSVAISTIVYTNDLGSAITSTIYLSGVGSPEAFYGIKVSRQLMAVADIPADWATTPELPGAILGNGLIHYPDFITTTALTTITPGSITLRSVVESVASRCNVPASKINAIALTDIIPGFLVAQQFSGADTLRPTQQAFFYDLPEVDGQIKAIKRGGATSVSITDDDLLETGQDDERVRGQIVEYPLKVSVVTQDPAAEYAAVPQTSGRSSPDFEGTSEVVIQLPIPFSAAIAAQIAHKSHKVMHSMAEGRVELSLPENFSRYIASDAFNYQSKRWLIEEVRYSEGECHWKAVYDRASSYGSLATGNAPRPPELPTSGLRGPTLLAAMNLPALREQDNVPGIYLAATGAFTGWNGCVVEMSADGGASFATLTTITGRSVMGRLSAAITSSSEPIPVILDDGELDSVTPEALALDANAFAIIAPGDVSEIGQFQTATEGAPGAYDLTTVTRGGEGTAAVAHDAGERFVMLANSVFVPIDSSLAGKTLILRAVTNGTVPENNQTISFVYQPITPVVPGETFNRIDASGDLRIDADDNQRITN